MIFFLTGMKQSFILHLLKFFTNLYRREVICFKALRYRCVKVIMTIVSFWTKTLIFCFRDEIEFFLPFLGFWAINP